VLTRELIRLLPLGEGTLERAMVQKAVIILEDLKSLSQLLIQEDRSLFPTVEGHLCETLCSVDQNDGSQRRLSLPREILCLPESKALMRAMVQ
jgi:hypothetical protein